MTWQSFAQLAFDILDIPSEQRRLERLGEIQFDSLASYELLVAVEDLGVEIDEERWVQADTAREYYDLYLSTLEQIS